MNDNRIINGDMRIDQRNNGASGTAPNVYTVDRWKYVAFTASKMTWQRIAGPVSSGFPYCLMFISSSSYSTPATESYAIWQNIEADMVADIAFGTSNAQTLTLSFMAGSSLTGTFSGAIGNGTRSYPFTFSLPTASTWTKISITIPGDTTGTWTLSGNGIGLYVAIDLGSGANTRGPAGAWSSTAWVAGVTGAVSVIGTNGATFYMTGVKLEVGSVATPFNRQSLAKSMADCQRYYQQRSILITGYGTAGSTFYSNYMLPVTMRSSPTLVLGTTSYTNASGASTGAYSGDFVSFAAIATATGAGSAQAVATFSAEL
jgi:hypothetical protein